MDASVFERYRKLIYNKSGIVLTPEKKNLLVSRLQKRIRTIGASGEKEYLQIIESDLSGQELVELLNAISTNTTYFWREPRHFEDFCEILKNYNSEQKTKVRIWCAASSTGQEPYTLAACVLDNLNSLHDVQILASDVSLKALNLACEAKYSEKDISKLPKSILTKHFFRSKNLDNSESKTWEPKEELKRIVTFKKLNLVEFPYPLKGPIDVIFCRNVMIYFDTETRKQVINQFERLLAPGGYLFLSLSENLLGVKHDLLRVDNSIFQKKK